MLWLCFCIVPLCLLGVGHWLYYILMHINSSLYIHIYIYMSILVVWFECRFLVTEVDGSNPGNSMLFAWARYFICIASVDSAVKWVPGGDNLMKDVQCYELFGGIALKNHAFSFHFFIYSCILFFDVFFGHHCYY